MRTEPLTFTINGVEVEYLTMEELAERWRTTPGGLHKRRHRQGTLPRGYKLGKRVLFKVADVLAFEQSRRDPAAALTDKTVSG